MRAGTIAVLAVLGGCNFSFELPMGMSCAVDLDCSAGEVCSEERRCQLATDGAVGDAGVDADLVIDAAGPDGPPPLFAVGTDSELLPAPNAFDPALATGDAVYLSYVDVSSGNEVINTGTVTGNTVANSTRTSTGTNKLRRDPVIAAIGNNLVVVWSEDQTSLGRATSNNGPGGSWSRSNRDVAATIYSRPDMDATDTATVSVVFEAGAAIDPPHSAMLLASSNVLYERDADAFSPAYMRLPTDEVSTDRISALVYERRGDTPALLLEGFTNATTADRYTLLTPTDNTVGRTPDIEWFDGEYVTAWADSDGGNRDIQLAFTAPGQGETTDPVVRFLQIPTAGDSFAPKLASSADYLAVLWLDNTTGGIFQVWVSIIDVDDGIALPATRVSAQNPTLAKDSLSVTWDLGQVVMVWDHADPSLGGVFINRATPVMAP